MKEDGREAFQRAVPQLQHASDTRGVYVDFSTFGISTYEEHQDFETYLYDHRNDREQIALRESATLLLSEPLPCKPEPNFPSELPMPSPGELTFTETETVGTDHFTPMYYRVTEVMSDEDVLGTFVDPETGFKSQYENVDDEAKLRAIQRLRNFSANADPEVIVRSELEGNGQRTFAEFCLRDISCVLNTVVRLKAADSGNRPKVVIRNCKGNEIQGGVGAEFAEKAYPDLVLALMFGRDTKSICPLAVVEMKGAPIDRVVFCIKWHFYLVFGGPRPDYPEGVPFEEPSSREIRASVLVVNQLLLYSFETHNPRVIVSDCRSATLIEFDLPNACRYKSIEEIRGMLNVVKDGEIPEVLQYKGRCPPGFCSFKYRTTYYNSTDLPMKLMIAATAWRQLEVVWNGQFEEQRKTILRFSKKLGLSDSDVVLRMNERAEEKKRKKELKEQKAAEKRRRKDGQEAHHDGEMSPPLSVSSDSSVSSNEVFRGLYDKYAKSRLGMHVDKLNLDPIQLGSEYVNQVVRLRDYACLFPKLSEDSIIFKVLDLGCLEDYYHICRGDLRHMSCSEFEDLCVEWYRDEVECYLRIEQYNRTATDKIYAPKMLDHGTCYVRDVSRSLSFQGYYLVLEDLGENQVLDGLDIDVKALLDHQISLLASIGIYYRDLALRNYVVKDGHVYVFDYNRVILDNPDL